MPPQPDSPPESLHHDGDVLAGWDEAAPSDSRRRLNSDFIRHARRRTLGRLPALAIVASGGLAGGFVGALLARRRQSLGAGVGSLAGAAAAVAGVNLLDQGGEGT